jgi:HTH-type transcriptional regulator/antitoxin HipB
MTVDEVGRAVRRQRRQLRLRQAELAALAGVGNRFLSELENGKPTLEIGRVLKVLTVLGLEVALVPRTWPLVLGGSDA